MKQALIVSVIVSVLAIAMYIKKGYDLTCEVDSLLDRAQVSADREDMTEYLTQLKQNLERRGMTHGHFALIFKTPANDLALHFKTINRVLERLDSIKEIPKTETAYQVALDDIRGTIRELPNPALAYLWAKYWYLVALGIVIWAWPIRIGFRDGILP